MDIAELLGTVSIFSSLTLQQRELIAHTMLPRRPPTTGDIPDLHGPVSTSPHQALQPRDHAPHARLPRRARRGELVVTQGGPGDALYVVARGSVLIHRTGRGGDRRAMTVIE